MDKATIAKIKAGSRVKVHEKGGSVFEGTVIARKHGNETGATFTVRTTVAAVGVEKVYPLNSPTILNVEVLNSPRKVHRSKLYYLRNLSARSTRQKLRTKE
ncbi:MAG: 50S ribosomal protein L19 [Patescibacteria group bacterium]|nr:50S ribosomal protein L19 [Patescibacteria group bacterium]MCL5224048.1 50S ribosomal protein L19 [Patescibacteria group bacterium]